MDATAIDCDTANYTGLIAVGAITTSIGLITMLLRGVLWYSHKRKQGLDDVCMWAAWVFSIGYATASFHAARWGLGCKSSTLPLPWILKAIQTVYVIELFYLLSVFLVKISITCLYLRLAGPSNSIFRIATVVSIIFLIVQFVTMFTITAAQCRPVAKFWNPELPGHCLNTDAAIYSTAIFTVITDCVILVLPISTLWSIQRPKRERVALVAAFLLGFVSTIVAAVRLYSVYIYTISTDPIKDSALLNIWSFIEINCAILCASGPALRGLLFIHRKPESVPSPVDSGAWVSSHPSHVNGSAAARNQASNRDSATCVANDEGSSEKGFVTTHKEST